MGFRSTLRTSDCSSETDSPTRISRPPHHSPDYSPGPRNSGRGVERKSVSAGLSCHLFVFTLSTVTKSDSGPFGPSCVPLPPTGTSCPTPLSTVGEEAGKTEEVWTRHPQSGGLGDSKTTGESQDVYVPMLHGSRGFRRRGGKCRLRRFPPGRKDDPRKSGGRGAPEVRRQRLDSRSRPSRQPSDPRNGTKHRGQLGRGRGLLGLSHRV